MQVRPMRDAALDEVVAIWHASREGAHASMGVRGGHGLAPEESSRIFREVVLPRCRIGVAHREAGLLGFLAIRDSYVDRMYVLPAAQRGGVGTALLGKARAHCLPSKTSSPGPIPGSRSGKERMR